MFVLKKYFFLFFAVFIISIPCLSYSDSLGEKKLLPRDVIFSDVKDLRVILVDKKKQKLYLLENKDNFFRLIMEFKCSTGKNSGDKVVEGDSKTPEGVYLITGHYTKQYLSPVYGTRALTLDYPNYLDRVQGKNGYNIWIHGTDKEPLEERTTNGCVALANKDIDVLAGYVQVGVTPVIISENTEFLESETDYVEIKGKFSAFFNSWLKSLENGTYHEYLSFYSSDFLPEISWWTDWQKSKKKFDSFSLERSSLNVFRENKGIYAIWFNFFINTDKIKSEFLKRKLFVKYEDGELKIIGDVYVDESKNIVTAANEIKDKVLFKQDVKELINIWAKAWSDKDISIYGNCYSSDFFSEGMNKKLWLKYKDKLNQKYDYIKIDIENPRIEKKGRHVKAVFFQNYESSGFSTKGIKTLVLKKEEGQWRILKESWKETG
ncbi:MAG: L,D-transpeptidase family protein [Desulfobacteraceae bacterium]|nr:L,D-transpeptidase family protein [Desulfobacteraceae bacterium]